MEKWDDLKLFLTVARAGTLSAAADELEVSASTLHRRLQGFETELGSTLFEKSPRGYQLTAAGEALLPRAEEVEEAVYAAGRVVRGHDQQASGEVRITLPLVLLPVIAPHLAAFSRMCRRIRPCLQADDGRLDLERETDIAFRATSQPADSAHGRRLSDLAWARYACVETVADDLPWIHYMGMNHSPAVQWRKKAFPASKPVMSVGGIVAMHSVLAESSAQGLLPCFVGEADAQLRRIGEPVATNQLWLLVHADLRRTARVRAVIDFLVPRLLEERARFEGTASPEASSGSLG